MTWLLLVRDTMGWWGALAWIISLDDALRWLRSGSFPKQVRAINPLAATIAMAILSLGLIVVGTSLPLHTRLDAFAGDSVPFRLALAVGWVFIASAGWAFVIARAPRPAMIFATASLAFGGTALAAALTAGFA